MENLLKYKEIDLGIYNKEDLRKADKYNPVYKRLDGKSITNLAMSCGWTGNELKRISEELTHVFHS